MSDGLTCEQAQEAISARFDGEPAPVDEDAVTDHLEACGSCRSFESSLADLGRRFRVRSTISAPPVLISRLQESRADQLVGRRRVVWERHQWSRVARWAVALSPALLVVVLISVGADASQLHPAPDLTHTQCNTYLVSHHLWAGY